MPSPPANAARCAWGASGGPLPSGRSPPWAACDAPTAACSSRAPRETSGRRRGTPRTTSRRRARGSLAPRGSVPILRSPCSPPAAPDGPLDQVPHQRDLVAVVAQRLRTLNGDLTRELCRLLVPWLADDRRLHGVQAKRPRRRGIDDH